MCNHFEYGFQCKNRHKYDVTIPEYSLIAIRSISVVHAEEESIKSNYKYYEIFELIVDYNLVEEFPELVVLRRSRSYLKSNVQHDPLHFHPFLLFFREAMRAFFFPDLFIELVYDDRNEKVHYKECCYENEGNK
jgi:hypothetical protein